MNLSLLQLSIIYFWVPFFKLNNIAIGFFFQIRGFLSRYHLVLPASLAFDKCIACSSKVGLTLPAVLLLQTDLGDRRRGKGDASLLSHIPMPIIPLNKTRLHRFVTMASMVVLSKLIRPSLILKLLHVLVFRALPWAVTFRQTVSTEWSGDDLFFLIRCCPVIKKKDFHFSWKFSMFQVT